MDNEEVEVGLSCVAVPVFSAPGQVSCSISISGMTPRVRTALRGGLLDDLRQASADISRSLYGYQPPVTSCNGSCDPTVYRSSHKAEGKHGFPSAFFCLSAAQQTANLTRKDPFTPSAIF